MDDVEKAPKDTATVPPAHGFLSKSPGNPIVPATTDVCLFVYALSVLFMHPGSWPRNLNIQHRALSLPAVDGCKNGS